MKVIVKENILKIVKGDNVEGREFLKNHLEAEIAKKLKKLKI